MFFEFAACRSVQGHGWRRAGLLLILPRLKAFSSLRFPVSKKWKKTSTAASAAREKLLNSLIKVSLSAGF